MNIKKKKDNPIPLIALGYAAKQDSTWQCWVRLPSKTQQWSIWLPNQTQQLLEENLGPTFQQAPIALGSVAQPDLTVLG